MSNELADERRAAERALQAAKDLCIGLLPRSTSVRKEVFVEDSFAEIADYLGLGPLT